MNLDIVKAWIIQNKNIFLPPTAIEAKFIQNQLFTIKNGHYQYLISKETRLIGKPCADPFLIAKAYTNNFTLVTQEKYKLGAAKIPVACKEFDITCCNFEEFMEKENWIF